MASTLNPGFVRLYPVGVVLAGALLLVAAGSIGLERPVVDVRLGIAVTVWVLAFAGSLVMFALRGRPTGLASIVAQTVALLATATVWGPYRHVPGGLPLALAGITLFAVVVLATILRADGSASTGGD